MNAASLEVRDYMTKHPITVSPHTEITAVVGLLIENDISGVIVVDDKSAVIGVLTERDCIAAAASADYYGEWGGPVRNFMSAPATCVGPDENLVDVAVRLTQSRFRRFPVVADGRLVGLLTRRDVLRALEGGSWTKSMQA